MEAQVEFQTVVKVEFHSAVAGGSGGGWEKKAASSCAQRGEGTHVSTSFNFGRNLCLNDEDSVKIHVFHNIQAGGPPPASE